jgi:Domain of unknown function (DUF1854)
MTSPDVTPSGLPANSALAARFDLIRQPSGRLQLTTETGEIHTDVVPVRAFPLAAPGEGISLVSTDGHELAWITDVRTLPPAARALLEHELAQRDFVPEVTRLVSVSTFATPSVWTVETDRGPTSFILKGEEDIRRLGDGALLITASQGVHFRVRDMRELDRGSRKLLERFL